MASAPDEKDVAYTTAKRWFVLSALPFAQFGLPTEAGAVLRRILFGSVNELLFGLIISRVEHESFESAICF
jgi:hypothetical protein